MPGLLAIENHLYNFDVEIVIDGEIVAVVYIAVVVELVVVVLDIPVVAVVVDNVVEDNGSLNEQPVAID